MKNYEDGLFSENVLARIRERFCHVDSDPYTGSRIYLENAGGSLTLKSVIDIVAEQTAMPDNAGRNNPASRAISRMMAAGKADVLRLLGAHSGVVMFGESTTANVFRMLSALMHGVPGGNVVTTNLDHPAVYDSTRILCERFGKQWRVAGLNPATGTVPAESILQHIDKDTIVLSVIHGSNILGTVNDIARIVEEARRIKPDLYVIADGAQHGAHGSVDVEALGCDAYTLGSYKLFSKVGASVAWLSDRLAALPHDRLLGKPESHWELGTREQAGYAGWTAVVDYLCWLGGHQRMCSRLLRTLQLAR